MCAAQELGCMPSMSPMVLPHIPQPDTRIPHAALPHHHSDNARAWAGVRDHPRRWRWLYSGGIDNTVKLQQYQETCLGTMAVWPRCCRSVSGGCGVGGGRELALSLD